MNNAGGMRRVECVRDLDGVAEDLVDRERAFGQAVSERLTFQKLHYQVAGAVLMPNVVEDADVRVIQR